MHKQYKLTADGIAELEQELKVLIANRSDIAERIKSAREFGDLAENAEYSAARQEQERAEARIAEIDFILKNAETISQPKKKDVVELGNTVVLKNKDGERTFTIVGSVEANPLEGKISDESPIGQALLGKKLGEAVEIKTPASTTSYTIGSIQ
ncbi:MAG TPA: transcription elongation factor GreA [Candidatus Saccharibacteria bacterium]|jgi:transcription elongation factor GreA|nr:transcription elongation factor GreA [Candidatus Saccharibacteria bacterium]HMT55427.1 transcription elongation factor GreA [Candidatus Saccharibacteria bacterium]